MEKVEREDEREQTDREGGREGKDRGMSRRIEKKRGAVQCTVYLE